MAYDTAQIERQLLENIQADEDITTFEDAAATVEPSRQTLYNWEFDKLDSLKSAIAQNKTTVKRNLRKQWKKEDASPTLQLALYKLLSNEDELRALSMEKREHSGDVKLTMPKFVMDEKSDSKESD